MTIQYSQSFASDSERTRSFVLDNCLIQDFATFRTVPKSLKLQYNGDKEIEPDNTV